MRVNKEFRIFFEGFFVPVCRFIERYVKETEVSTDIAQEVFVRVYEKWSEFETLENVKAFMYTIARNLSLDHLKHQKAQLNYLSQYRLEEEVDDPVFLKEVTREETFRILYAAINQLPPQGRQIILLSMEGKNNAEVGEILGISVNTVKTLKKNAYASLRSLLSREYLILLFSLLLEC